ncbi:hypothetical protein EMCRGX_G010913 [Ephydatia muelleri]
MQLVQLHTLLHLVLKRSKALCKLVTITCFKTTEHTGVVDRVRCWNIHYLKIHFEGYLLLRSSRAICLICSSRAMDIPEAFNHLFDINTPV